MRKTASATATSTSLDGGKRFITNAGVAFVYVVFAKTDAAAGHGGISAFVVEADAPGLEVGPDRAEDGDQGLDDRRALLRRLPHPGLEPPGEEGEGFRIAMQILDRSRPGDRRAGLGLAQGATDYAVEYARTRETMGRPIGKHQLIARCWPTWRCAARPAAGCSTRWGRMIDEGETAELTKLSAMAKLYCTDTAMDVTTDAVQILGGNG